jgi:hypothetical protein
MSLQKADELLNLESEPNF